MNETSDSDDIAVVGMACRFPGAQNIREYWKLLENGTEALTNLSDEELAAEGVDEADLKDPNYVKAGMFLDKMEYFDPGFFGLSPLEGRIMDPQHRHLLECAWEALEDGCQVPEKFDGAIGVFAGSGHNVYFFDNLNTNEKLKDEVGAFLLRHTGNDKDFLATRVSYALDLKGPSINVQTACSTSLVTIHSAIQSLLNGECDMALAGGVTINLPHRQGYIYKENEILSPDGHCRPFDASSKGTIFGSGAGVVVLKRLDDALADGDPIHAVLKSSAINNDGADKVSYLAPSVSGQAAAIKEALDLADIDPDSVTYIECHGTGTQLGDPIEIAALTEAYGQSTANKHCAIGSVKSNIGHLDTAAGVASLIKVILSLKHKKQAPTLHYQAPNKSINFAESKFFVNAELRDWQDDGPLRAGVSSLGVGGTNAHIILEEAQEQTSGAADKEQQLLVFSAKTKRSLDGIVSSYADWLKDNKANLADIAYSLTKGRKAFEHRCCVSGSTADEIASALEGGDTDAVFRHRAQHQKQPVVFMFAGGGAQYPNMGLDLYESEPTYKTILDECIGIIGECLSLPDFNETFFPPADQYDAAAKKMQRPMYALPALFATQYAQAKLWLEWGIEADAYIGHSMGEYTASCLAGVFSLRDAIAIVCKRAELFETLPAGAMVSVMATPEQVQPLLTNTLSIAAINAEELCLASGEVSAIEALEAALDKKEIDYQRMLISVAAHSAMLDPILPAFSEFLQNIQFNLPSQKVASNLSGNWQGEDVSKPQYWVDHLRNTVRFSEGLEKITVELQNPVLLEIGPGRTLCSLARSHTKSDTFDAIINGMRHPKQNRNDQAFMLTALGRLWACGAKADLNRLYEDQDRIFLSMPTYAFDQQPLWVKPAKAVGALNHKRKTVDQWFYQPSWRLSASASDASTPQSVLLLGYQDTPFWNYWKESLINKGTTVKTVSIGDGVDPSSAQDYEGLLESINSQQPVALIHGWTLGNQCSGFDSLLALSQALSNVNIERCTLLILTEGSQSLGSEPIASPENAMLAGMAPVISNEISQAGVSVIDIDDCQGRHLQQQINLLNLELGVDYKDNASSSLCIRKGQRFEKEYRPTVLRSSAEGNQFQLSTEGCYVITGGLGGLGLQLANFLASNTKGVKLALLSRSGLPDEEQWAERIKRNSRVSRRIQTILQLREEGAAAKVYQVDIADQAALEKVIEQVANELGPVKGAFHTAGTIDDQLIPMKSSHSANSVLTPKVQGVNSLEQSLVKFDVEFIFLYSSVSAVIGTPGQIDYAAANAYLDAFAQSRRQQTGLPIYSIGWSAWQQIGMAAELASGVRDIGTGFASFKPYFENNKYLCEISEDFWVMDDHRTKAGLAVMPGTGYLNYIYQAAQAKFKPNNKQGIEISNTFFVAPLALKSGNKAVVGVCFEEANGSTRLSIQTAASPQAANEDDWQSLHVESQVSILDTSEKPKSDAIDAIRDRCNISTEAVNGSVAHDHMDFGFRWSSVKNIHFGKQESLAELFLPKELVNDLEDYPLHPGMLDFATAAGHKLALSEEHKDMFFVPQSYGRIRVFAPLTQHIYSHVVLKPNTGPVTAKFDVQLLSISGELLIDIEDFVVRRMEGGSLDVNTQQERELAVDLAEAISPDEGNQVVLRLLEHPEISNVMVSPYDFATVLNDAFSLSEASDTDEEASERPDLDQDYVAPETPEQEKIAALWSEALGVSQVGVKDNFFELGGHSLLLIKLVGKTNKTLSVSLKVSALFDDPTVEKWARIATEAQGSSTPQPKKISRVSRDQFRR